MRVISPKWFSLDIELRAEIAKEIWAEKDSEYELSFDGWYLNDDFACYMILKKKISHFRVYILNRMV